MLKVGKLLSQGHTVMGGRTGARTNILSAYIQNIFHGTVLMKKKKQLNSLPTLKSFNNLGVRSKIAG